MAKKMKCPKCGGKGRVFHGGPLGLSSECDRCKGKQEVDGK